MSKVKLPKHVRFTDGLKTFDLQLQDGSRGISEGGSSPSTLQISGGGNRTGDFEPNFSHIEQRTWHGGRGLENLVDDPSRYYDGQSLWSLTSEKLFPAPLWKFAKGIRTTDEYLTSDRSWRKLVNTSRFISVATGAITADKSFLWIRRVGDPGTLTLELRADSSGDPDGSVYQTVTKTISDIGDWISVFQEFDWTSTQAMSSGDHIVLYGASTDTPDNCWEVAVDAATSTSKIAAAGSGDWAPASFTMLYRLTDADIKRKWLDFNLEGAKYIVSVEDNGGNSVLMINGGRGTASSGSSTTLVDTGIGWTASRFINAWVKIIGGTGKGQKRKITGNTTDTLTVATWNINPDSTSRYVIYHTPWFTTIGTTGLGKVSSVAVLNNIAYFAQGAGDPIRKMYDNAGTHTFSDDGTNEADILFPFNDAADGPQMWRAINGTTVEVSRADKQAFGTALAFAAGIAVGSADYPITNMRDYNDQLWVTKYDSAWFIQNDRASRLPIGLDGIPGPETGQALAVHNLFLYISWWKSIERMYGGTVDDEGIWRGTGLPTGRNGNVASVVALLPWLFQAIDAGSDGISSVYIMADGAYHEMFRGQTAGFRVRNIFTQTNESANPWLWISYNGELVYQEYSLTPLRETFEFQHEAVFVSSVIDMGHAESYKFFKSLSASTENLNKNGIRIDVDFQFGKNVNTDNWKRAQSFYYSPTDEINFDVGETSRIKYRLRILTDDASVAPVINSLVLKGYEVLPVKRLWNMRLKVSSNIKGSDPDELYDWLWAASQRARKIQMYTVFPGIDNVLVKLEPPNTFWRFVNKAAKWTGVMQISVREM